MSATAKEAVRTVVEKSKLFTSVNDKPTGDVDRLEIVLDNVGDLGDAAGKGALTGVTFGAVGSPTATSSPRRSDGSARTP